ncbi:hypothetical protein AMEX_G1900 [Astyanax mexicanus]|uniref:Uncharacterized protein n=1 Tax=Astyanax mexicanus TaxID=7994 RepID=A0A8T2MRB7_ASTMX|nr:hypothetical protein AMEX_G1900 [Astyanax mexicanus]
MEALEKQLKNKKVKTHFCFFAKDVRKIEGNRKLKSFLDASKDAKFPDLPIELFFAKKEGLQDKSLPEKDSNEDDFTNSTGLNSSGYESLCSQNSSQSIVSKDPLLESKDQTFDSAASNTQHQIESTAQIHQENKDGSPLEKEMEAQVNICEQHASPQKSNAFKVAEDLQVLPFYEPDHEDGTPEQQQENITQMQCDPETDRNEHVFNSDQVMDEVSQEEHEDLNFSNQKLPSTHYQNVSHVQMHHEHKEYIPLEEVMEEQGTVCEKMCEPLIDKSHIAGTIPATTQSVATEDRIQSVTSGASEEKSESYSITLPETTVMSFQKQNVPKKAEVCHLDQKLDMRESKSTPHVQCDPETARNEPFVEPDCVGISEDKKQGMDEVSQKEPKLPADHFQNGSPVQIQNDNKDGIPLAEGLFSMPVSDSGKITGKAKRQPRNTSKLRSEHRRLLYDWALKKCSIKEEIEKVFDCISIQNQVEHGEYPCFVAENIMIYTDPKNGDKQIIVTDDKNKDVKNNLPKEITFIPEYQMWVCGIKKAVVIRNLEERELRFKSFDLILQSCKELVFEALAPALAVFKHIQRQERLYSLTKDH